MRNKYRIITKNCNGGYDNLSSVKGYIIIGGEDEVNNCGDSFFIIYSKNPTKMTPQEIYDINKRLFDGLVDGFESCRGDEDNTFIEK